MISLDYKIFKEALSKSPRKCYRPNSKKVAECDGGAVGGGGDAGGAPIASGGLGAEGTAPVIDNATSSTEVLGKCDHSHGGYFGHGCFHVPFKCSVPFHRWEVGNGGSKRKKDKKGKPKKTPYEHGMKVVYDMLNEDDIQKVKIPKKLLSQRLKKIARAIRTMDDVEIANKQFERDGAKKLNQIPSNFAKAKSAFSDIGAFLKDICKGNYKASWFTISLLAVAIIYVLCPIDLIPDAIPGFGQIDDITVIMWVYTALKSEFENWNRQKSQLNVGEMIKEELAKKDEGKVKIWVDDVRPSPTGFIWIKSVDEFIDAIIPYGDNPDLSEIELIDIDHDAGDFQKNGGDYIRCLDFLEFIGAKNVKIKIHSANPVGVKNMRAIIQKNNWIEVR